MTILNLRFWMLSILLGVGLVGATPAFAQFAAQSSGPSNVSADSVDYRPDVTILTGQVDFRQADVRVLSDVMKIYAGQAGDTGAEAFENINRIEAIGNFYYITPDQEVRGKQGVYESKSDTFTVTGDVILLQGEDNVVKGDKLVYNLTTNQAKVVGTCKGRKCGRKGRVNILIKNSGTTQGQ